MLVQGIAELELRIRQNDTVRKRELGGRGVNMQRDVAQPLGCLSADLSAHLPIVHRFVVARRRLGRRREDRLRKLLRFAQALVQRDATDAAALLIFSPARPGQVTTDDELDRDDLGRPADHGP